MLWSRLICGDEGEIDLVGAGRTQGYLSLFCLFLNPLESIWLTTEIYSFLRLEIRDYPVDDGIIPVITAQLSVSIGGHYFKHSISNIEDRDIERSATKVVDCDFLVALLVQTVS